MKIEFFQKCSGVELANLLSEAIMLNVFIILKELFSLSKKWNSSVFRSLLLIIPVYK